MLVKFLEWLLELVSGQDWEPVKQEPPPPPPPPVNADKYFYEGVKGANAYRPDYRDNDRAKFNLYGKDKILAGQAFVHYASFSLIDGEWRPMWTKAGYELLKKLPAEAPLRTILLAKNIEDTEDFENNHRDVRLGEWNGIKCFVFAADNQPFRNENGALL